MSPFDFFAEIGDVCAGKKRLGGWKWGWFLDSARNVVWLNKEGVWLNKEGVWFNGELVRLDGESALMA